MCNSFLFVVLALCFFCFLIFPTFSDFWVLALSPTVVWDFPKNSFLNRFYFYSSCHCNSLLYSNPVEMGGGGCVGGELFYNLMNTAQSSTELVSFTSDFHKFFVCLFVF